MSVFEIRVSHCNYRSSPTPGSFSTRWTAWTGWSPSFPRFLVPPCLDGASGGFWRLLLSYLFASSCMVFVPTTDLLLLVNIGQRLLPLATTECLGAKGNVPICTFTGEATAEASDSGPSRPQSTS